MTTEATKADATTTVINRTLFGRMTAAERLRGRFLRSPDGHPDAPPAPDAASEPPAEPPADSAPPSDANDAPPADASGGLVRPEGLDDKFWDAATGVKVGDLVEHLRELEAKAAAREDVPGEAESYDLKLPEGFEVPKGLEIEFKADDPLWADFQSLGKKHGLTREGFGEFVGAFAKYQLAQRQADIDTFVEQKAALGANADTRIKAAGDWLKANMKAEHADALADLTVSKAGVEAIEALIRMKSGPVAATPGGAAANVNKFEGLQGEELLHAIRSQAA